MDRGNSMGYYLNSVQDKNFDILIDSMSFQYINGAFVDCKTHEGQEGLIISNPNAGKVEGENAV